MILRGASVVEIRDQAVSEGMLTLRMDGFAWLFAMLVTVMGALVILYARYYMAAQDPVPRFFSFFLAFMGAMLGVVLSGIPPQLPPICQVPRPTTDTGRSVRPSSPTARCVTARRCRRSRGTRRRGR